MVLEIVLRMRTHIHAPREVVQQTFTLFVMYKGVCARNGNILTQGMAWGEDFILDNIVNCISFPSFTVTFVQLGALLKADLYEAAEICRESIPIIRRAKARLGVIRGVQRYACKY
jgi:hypothetical protein